MKISVSIETYIWLLFPYKLAMPNSAHSDDTTVANHSFITLSLFSLLGCDGRKTTLDRKHGFMPIKQRSTL